MAQSSPEAIVLFSGPGGSSLGLQWAGVSKCIGVEWEANAVATARAAGFTVEHADVRELSPRAVAAQHIDGGAPLVLQASPPCQGLSMAGKGTGREDLIHLLAAIDDLRGGPMLGTPETVEFCEDLRAWLVSVCSDERSPLTFEMVRWIAELEPDYVMLEQVPAALPIWEAVTELLRVWGYSVWCGNLQAEQFGVPQTRKRAFLVASRHHAVGAPVPTHSKYYSRSPEKLDVGVEKWVSMAEALGWGMAELVGFPRRADTPSNAAGDNVVEIDGVEYRARDLRGADQPAQVVTGKTRSWKRYPDAVVVTGQNSEMGGGVLKPYERSVDAPAPTLTSQSRSWRVEGRPPTHMGDVYNSNGCIRSVDEPAPTMTASMDNGNFKWIDEEHPPAKAVDRLAVRAEVEGRVNNQSGTEFDLAWPADRPAPVIAGRGLVTMPGANANRFNGATKSRNDGIRVEVFEAGILQSFPEDYPWQGTKTAQFQCVGNAVPPLLQCATAGQLLAPLFAGAAA